MIKLCLFSNIKTNILIFQSNQIFKFWPKKKAPIITVIIAKSKFFIKTLMFATVKQFFVVNCAKKKVSMIVFPKNAMNAL